VWKQILETENAKSWGTSYDGDADRIVFYTYDNGDFKLIDGDRLSVLYANTVGKF